MASLWQLTKDGFSSFTHIKKRFKRNLVSHIKDEKIANQTNLHHNVNVEMIISDKYMVTAA